MADPGWLSMGDPAGSAWPTLGGSVSPTPVAQYRVTADRLRGLLLLDAGHRCLALRVRCRDLSARALGNPPRRLEQCH